MRGGVDQIANRFPLGRTLPASSRETLRLCLESIFWRGAEWPSRGERAEIRRGGHHSLSPKSDEVIYGHPRRGAECPPLREREAILGGALGARARKERRGEERRPWGRAGGGLRVVLPFFPQGRTTIWPGALPRSSDQPLPHPPIVLSHQHATRALVRHPKLAEHRPDVGELPCLDDQPVAEVREDDLVDLKRLPRGRDPGELSAKSGRHDNPSHRA